MIISASRRTDIPSYYSDWFFNRLAEGFVYVRNPMNIHRVGKISLNKDVVDGIVFWTKNPAPMIPRLKELKEYSFYFQFTLNAYQNDVEVNIPPKNDVIIPTFQKLSDQIGPERVVWRYDPIFISEKYSLDYHISYFQKLAKRLSGYSKKCTISFIDYYRNTANNIKGLGISGPSDLEIKNLASSLSQIAFSFGFSMDTCAEKVELDDYGITHARCIDDKLLEKISGNYLKIPKDKSQRLECGCISSIDIGMYNTCKNCCKYCYANHSQKTVHENANNHDKFSPLISGLLRPDDIVSERKTVSNRISAQKNLLDY